MICDFCKLEMSTPPSSSCTITMVGNRDAIPWSGIGRCPDCGVQEGGYHHPGCDKEMCPECGKQLIASSPDCTTHSTS